MALDGEDEVFSESTPEPSPVVFESLDVDDSSGVEVRLSFPFRSLVERLRESPLPLLIAEASTPSLLLALPMLGFVGRVSVVDDIDDDDDEEDVDDDTDVEVLNTWVTLSITLPLRILPIVLA